MIAPHGCTDLNMDDTLRINDEEGLCCTVKTSSCLRPDLSFYNSQESPERLEI